MDINILKEAFRGNELVVNELNHMQQNICDKIEYYTAYQLMRKEVEKLIK